MRTCRTVCAALILTVPGWAGDSGAGLTIYLTNANIADSVLLARAKGVAAEILASAGVAPEWRTGLAKQDGRGIVQIEFVEKAPARFEPTAMAYATPYRQAGTCIHVFYDRVLHMRSRQLAPVLLGHVLAHEIAHVLEGVARHSEAGVMKAAWESDDYDAMAAAPLAFTKEDVELIRGHWRR